VLVWTPSRRQRDDPSYEKNWNGARTEHSKRKAQDTFPVMFTYLFLARVLCLAVIAGAAAAAKVALDPTHLPNLHRLLGFD
jgi:hypothetical protein